MLHRAKAYPAKRRFLATLGLSLVTSAGFVLSFTVLDAPDDAWRATVVGITALMVPPFLAGWLSPHPSYVAFFPTSLLVGLTVAEAIYGSVAYESEPFFFIPLLTIMYGAGHQQRSSAGGWLIEPSPRLTERR